MQWMIKQLKWYINHEKKVFFFNRFLLDHPDTLVETYKQYEYLVSKNFFIKSFQEKHSLLNWRFNTLQKWCLLTVVTDGLTGNEKLHAH